MNKELEEDICRINSYKDNTELSNRTCKRTKKITIRNRHAGRFISNYEALAYVEKIIYKYLKRK